MVLHVAGLLRQIGRPDRFVSLLGTFRRRLELPRRRNSVFLTLLLLDHLFGLGQSIFREIYGVRSHISNEAALVARDLKIPFHTAAGRYASSVRRRATASGRLPAEAST